MNTRPKDSQNEQGPNAAVPSTPEGAQAPLQGPRPLLLIIILDVTQSMDPYIKAVRNALYGVLDILMEGQFEAEVGMLLFRDELIGEMPEVYAPGTPPEELKSVLANTKAMGGGDPPESSLPAIMRALEKLGEPSQQTPCVFLHITDAATHDPEGGHTADSVREALLQHSVLFFACAPQVNPYLQFCNVTGGTLFPIERDMDAKTFEAVLEDFARATVRTVRKAEEAVSPEVFEDIKALRTRQ